MEEGSATGPFCALEDGEPARLGSPSSSAQQSVARELYSEEAPLEGGVANAEEAIGHIRARLVSAVKSCIDRALPGVLEMPEENEALEEVRSIGDSIPEDVRLLRPRRWMHYGSHVLVNLALYIFAPTALVLWPPVLSFNNIWRTVPGLEQELLRWVAASNLVAVTGICLDYWHYRLNRRSILLQLTRQLGTPAEVMDRMEAFRFQQAAQLDASECPICLEEWCPEDLIRRMPCGHVFHDACLAGWLRNRRTCALCRYDVVAETLHQPLL